MALTRLTTLLLIGLSALIFSEMASAQNYFRSPPTEVSIHNPSSTEGQRNRTTISIRVPANAGAKLEHVVLSQLSSLDRWKWGRRNPEIYLGDYLLRHRGEPGLSKAIVTESGNELSIRFDPPIGQGRQVNIVFRGFNPKADIYQWATSLIPAGNDPITSDGPTLRLSVYPNIDYW